MSRDEKQFSRQLEQALEASKNDQSNNVSVSSGSTIETPMMENSSTTKESKDEEFIPDATVSSFESEGESYSAAEDEDSDFMISPEPKQEKKKKKAVKESVKSVPKGKQVKTAKKLATKSEPLAKMDNLNTIPLVGKGTKSTVTAKGVQVKSSPCVAKTKSASLTHAKELDRPTSHTASGSPGVLGVNKRTMNWTPPAKIGKERTKIDSTLKPTNCAGGTPVIRVGLSRNARVKSLHTNVKS